LELLLICGRYEKMDLFIFFWLFFMISAIQPVIKQRMLEASRKKLISVIEEKFKSRLILLIHRQETMSFLGFPVMKYIDIHDSEEVIRAIHLTAPDVPIDLVVHTPGGLVLASLQIARALKRHKAKVRVFVPHYAMSGGTLIALAADEIVMTEDAVLGPVDPQLGQYPAASILKVVKNKSIDKVDDQTLLLADQAEKAIKQLNMAVFELLHDKVGEEKAKEIAHILSTGKWTHDYPISADEAKELGLPVNTDFPEEILKLMNLFPQPLRKIPSVEYLPYRKYGNNNEKSI